MGESHTPFIPPWLDDLDMKATTFRVLCHIIRRSSGGKSQCFESVVNMAAFLRMSKDTVRDAIRELEKAKLITADRKHGCTIRINLTLNAVTHLTLNKVRGWQQSGSGGNPKQGHKVTTPKVTTSKSFTENIRKIS